MTAALAGTSRPRDAVAFGETSDFSIGLLEHDAPAWNPRPNAIYRILREIEQTTSILTAQNETIVRPTGDALWMCPLVIVAGDRGFDPWPDADRNALALWLAAGGTLLFDGSEGRDDGDFDASVRRELDAIVPGHSLHTVGDDHVVYRTFYLVDGAPGREQVTRDLLGVTFDDRLAVIVNHNDMMGAIERDGLGAWAFEVHPGGQRQRDMAMRFAVNVAMYALCLDYKADQVHVPFLLDRRRWRVD
jgi:hypothetical protein